MRIILLSSLLLFTYTVCAQQPYYNDVNLSLTGQDLYDELQQKISNHNTGFTYGEIRDVLKITDENPQNNSDVLLVYGYNDSDGNCTTDRSRDKDDFGGTSCLYNREHVFARGNANPAMGNVDNNTTGIAADPHNVRPSDQQMNNNKGNKRMAAGSGNAGTVGSGNWYPGDEWKGDVARMMMYMYTRYGDRCLPSLNGVGSLQGSTEMLEIYLEWNADDPVSDFEDQRNPHLETVYGNRNPFIDNPYLATLIWGGPVAEDRWDLFDVKDINKIPNIIIAPNPTTAWIYLESKTSGTYFTHYEISTISGQRLQIGELGATTGKLDFSGLESGIYFLLVWTDRGGVPSTHKIVIK